MAGENVCGACCPAAAFAGALPLTSAADDGGVGRLRGAEKLPAKPRRCRRRASQVGRAVAALGLPPILKGDKRIFVQDVEVHGSTLLPKIVINALVEHYTGKSFAEEAFEDGAAWLKEWYHQGGYPTDEVTVGRQPTPADPTLVFVVTERRLGGVRFSHHRPGGPSQDGPGRTRPDVILRTLGLRLNDHFRMTQAMFEKLSTLQLFDNVVMEPERIDETSVHLHIVLFEQMYLEVAPALSATFSGGLVGGVQLTDRNLNGRAQKLSFSLNRSRDQDYELELDFIDPRAAIKRAVYGVSAKMGVKSGSGRGSAAKVWTMRPVGDSGWMIGSEAQVEQNSAPVGDSTWGADSYDDGSASGAPRRLLSRTASLAGTVALDRRRVPTSGSKDEAIHPDVYTGHRSELAVSRGLTWNDREVEAGATRDEGPTERVWSLTLKSARFADILRRRAAIAVGGEVVGRGDTAPFAGSGVLSSSLFATHGEVRGFSGRSLSSTWSLKAVAEARVPLRPDTTLFAFAESCQAALGGAKGDGGRTALQQTNVSSVGIGVRLLRAFSVVWVLRSDGVKKWSLLPIDRNF